MIDYAGSNVLGRSEYASESGRRPPSGMKWSVFAKQTKKRFPGFPVGRGFDSLQPTKKAP